MTVHKWYQWMKPYQESLSLLVPSLSTVSRQTGDIMCGECALVSVVVSPVHAAKLRHTHILKGELQLPLVSSN